MTTVAEVSILVKARDEASSVIDSVTGKIGGLGGIARTAALGLGAIGVVGVGAFAHMIAAAAEAQQVMAQSAAVIQSTGGAAGFTATQFAEMATELARHIPIDDEVIQKTENMLATFTQIKGDNFKAATEAALDMSVALGEDSSAAAMQLGKALNDPIAGVTALQRVGVRLTDQQKEQVKAMVEAGDVAGAQSVILRELQTEFGGSARAAGDTFAGKLSILKTQFGNLEEAIGSAFLPVLTMATGALANFLADHIDDIQRMADAFANQLAAGIHAAIDFLIANKDTIIAVFDTFKTGIETIAPLFEELFDFIMGNKVAMVIAIGAIGVAIVLAFGPISAAVAAIVGVILVIGYMREHWDEVKVHIVDTLNAVNDALRDKLGIWYAVIAFAIGVIVNFFREHWDEMSAIVRDHLELVKNIIVGYFAIFRDIFDFANAIFHGQWGDAWDALKALVGDTLGLIRDVIVGQLSVLRDIFLFGWSALVNIVGDKVDAIVSFMVGLTWRIGAAIAGLPGALYDLGRRAIQSLIDGLTSISLPDLTPGFDIPGVPILARGTDYFRGGLAIVGDQGPELLRLPRGSQVIPNDRLRARAGAAAATQQTIHIHQLILQGVQPTEALASIAPMLAR